MNIKESTELATAMAECLTCVFCGEKDPEIEQGLTCCGKGAHGACMLRWDKKNGCPSCKEVDSFDYFEYVLGFNVKSWAQLVKSNSALLEDRKEWLKSQSDLLKSQRELVKLSMQKKITFEVSSHLLAEAFPSLAKEVKSKGTVKLTGAETRFFTIIGNIAMRLPFGKKLNNAAAETGKDFFRLICSKTWTLEQIRDVAEFLAKFRASSDLIKNMALPKEYVRPSHLLPHQDRLGEQDQAAEYVDTWIRPFLKTKQFTTVVELLAAFGLHRSIKKVLEFEGEKGIDAFGRSRCVECGIKWDYRQEIQHAVNRSFAPTSGLQTDYHVPCELCHADGKDTRIFWDEMTKHCLEVHADLIHLLDICGNCRQPYVVEYDHGIVCHGRYSGLLKYGLSHGRSYPPSLKEDVDVVDQRLHFFAKEYTVEFIESRSVRGTPMDCKSRFRFVTEF